MNKTRENNYDLLRILACIAVIIIHVTNTYTRAMTNKHIFGQLYRENMLETTIWNTMVRFAVPIFVMLSGAFLLDNEKNKNYKEFYKKSFKRIIIPTMFFMIFYFIFSIFKAKVWEGAKLTIPIQRFFRGIPNAIMWYMDMMIGLYILVPLILRFKDHIGEKKFEKIAWIFLIITSFGNWGSKFYIKWAIGLSVEFLGYFTIGYILRKNIKDKKSNKKAVMYILIGIVFAIINTLLRYKFQISKLKTEGNLELRFVNNFNPLIIIQSILIFTGFSYMKLDMNFSKISNLTFAIFLFHVFVLQILERLIKPYISSISNLIIIPVEIILTFILSMIISIIYLKIKQAIENKLDISNRLSNFVVDKTANFLDK